MIALTGATGFIGQHILRELSARGYRVRVLLRRPTTMQMDCGSAIIGDLNRPQNLSAALQDVSAVIHSAGIAHAMTGRPEDDYRSLNTDATVNLAKAALRARVKRFVFLSSIRAQCGPASATVISEADEPRPTDDYGKSKLAAERGLAQLDIDWVALRPVLVYGPGVKGHMATLLRLAQTPLPLPLSGITARRSLLSVANLADAIDAVLTAPGSLRRPFIVADNEALTVGEIVAAIRKAQHRRANLLPVPEALLRLALRAIGRPEWSDRLTQPLVVDTSALSKLGWSPRVQTPAGLASLVTTGSPGQ